MKAKRITLPKLAEGERRRIFGFGRIPLDTAQLCCAELYLAELFAKNPLLGLSIFSCYI